MNKRIEPLEPREHNTVPLTEDEEQELENLRARGLEIEQALLPDANPPPDERQALLDEKSEVEKSVKGLEESIPLTEEEASFLKAQREQQVPLVARRSVLTKRKHELKGLISMTTPGSLRVYPNDSLQLRLMESDAMNDDRCATWDITLDRETLDGNGIDLKRNDRALLRLWIRRVSP